MTKSRESELLRLLLSSGKTFGQLETRLSCSRAELEETLESLESAGTVFAKLPNRISLSAEPNNLIAETILARLKTDLVGREVVVLRETGSTNDRIRQAGKGGANPGLVVFAEKQTAGRGQYGRRWESAAGAGLWGSLLLAANDEIADAKIVRAAATITAEALERFTSATVAFKQPNDLLIDHAKIAGFLLERTAAPASLVLGFGINVRSAPQIAGSPTTFADRYARAPLNRAALAAEILNQFDRWYQEANRKSQIANRKNRVY
jgi:BirA family transcriptional regulator, biotin operon repressor / biotin---[acetyl-CoA-carboxylase] ligase